jgi:hypothetical protein
MDDETIAEHRNKLFEEKIGQRSAWLEKYRTAIYQQQTHLLRAYFCDRCKLFMWHHLFTCFQCGGEMAQRKHTYKEMAELFTDYREGW